MLPRSGVGSWIGKLTHLGICVYAGILSNLRFLD